MTATKTRKVTKTQQAKALALVAAWLGPAMGCEGPAPTGEDAAHNGLGPMLKEDWDWPGKPTPTILLEGGPDDWAIEVSGALQQEFRKVGVFAEPYAGYALCLYVTED